MREALDNPKLDAPAKESLLLSICGERAQREGRNFVRVLIEADRIALLPEIAALFEALQGRGGRRGQGDDRDRVPAFEGNELAELTAALERRFKQEDRGRRSSSIPS